jgi:hypothetical protein
MKRIAVVYAVLLVAVLAVLLTGCSSTDTTSQSALQLAENEVTLAAYQAGAAAAPFGALGTEITMPLWLVSGE